MFQANSRAMESLLTDMLQKCHIFPTFFHPTGPVYINPRQFATYDQVRDSSHDVTYQFNTFTWFDYRSDREFCFDAGLKAIQSFIQDIGGIDGICGFSTGGALASIVAAALEGHRLVPQQASSRWAHGLRYANFGRPLRFAIIYSGFLPADEGLQWCFSPKISTPVLHLRGQLDTMIDEEDNRKLVETCENFELVVHPGGHFIPKFRPWVSPVARFILKQFGQN